MLILAPDLDSNSLMVDPCLPITRPTSDLWMKIVNEFDGSTLLLLPPLKFRLDGLELVVLLPSPLLPSSSQSNPQSRSEVAPTLEELAPMLEEPSGLETSFFLRCAIPRPRPVPGPGDLLLFQRVKEEEWNQFLSLFSTKEGGSEEGEEEEEESGRRGFEP